MHKCPPGHSYGWLDSVINIDRDEAIWRIKPGVLVNTYTDSNCVGKIGIRMSWWYMLADYVLALIIKHSRHVSLSNWPKLNLKLEEKLYS